MTVLIDLGLVRLFCALLCVINLEHMHVCFDLKPSQWPW
jgi:hypothetical protein